MDIGRLKDVSFRSQPLLHIPLMALQVARANLQPGNTWPHYKKTYKFTVDWFTGNIYTWKHHLRELRGKPGLKALEIGIYEGRSTFWLLENLLTAPDAVLTTIEPFAGLPDQKKTFFENVELSGLKKKLKVRIGNSWDVLTDYAPETFDFIYVDGNHEAAIAENDAKLSWKLLKPGGILVLDDYLWEGDLAPENRTRVGLDNFLVSIEGKYQILHRKYQLIIKKIDN